MIAAALSFASMAYADSDIRLNCKGSNYNILLEEGNLLSELVIQDAKTLKSFPVSVRYIQGKLVGDGLVEKYKVEDSKKEEDIPFFFTEVSIVLEGSFGSSFPQKAVALFEAPRMFSLNGPLGHTEFLNCDNK